MSNYKGRLIIGGDLLQFQIAPPLGFMNKSFAFGNEESARFSIKKLFSVTLGKLCFPPSLVFLLAQFRRDFDI